MKAPFETVVEENTAWLFALVRKHTDRRETAEDLVQEIWIRAFRVYDSYCEDGRLRHWLSRIALNHIRNTVSRAAPCPVSLDVPADGENDPLSTFLSAGASPEEDYLRSELTAEVLAAVAKLPEAQRQVVTFRYLDGLSVEETAKVMQIPKGTVKSKTHYAIDEIRKQLGLEDAVRPEKKKRKGVSIMECKEMYKYLFMYAMGKLPDEIRAAVAEHLKECKVCDDIAAALEKLIPTMVFAEEGVMSHYGIDFFDLNLSYVGVRTPVPDYEERNRLLEEWNGRIPDDQCWFECGHNDLVTTIGTFDNEGNEIDYPVYKTVEKIVVIKPYL
ncbi:MAG: sigma-70 family RNA polymerase sigma factor [Clostridia bacterium]|nr:sigma-70 family RNA polymerase sigma factor [Clostridia bacterium]